jgi:hypothetical protein
MPFDVDVEVLNGSHVARKGSYKNQYKHGKDTTSAVNVEVSTYSFQKGLTSLGK